VDQRDGDRALADGRGDPLDRMEIRISLERMEPPAGRLWQVRGAGPTPWDVEGREVPFTGWLGLLRALYEVLGQPGGHPPGA
jgi:hypothetical protein